MARIRSAKPDCRLNAVRLERPAGATGIVHNRRRLVSRGPKQTVRSQFVRELRLRLGDPAWFGISEVSQEAP